MEAKAREGRPGPSAQCQARCPGTQGVACKNWALAAENIPAPTACHLASSPFLLSPGHPTLLGDPACLPLSLLPKLGCWYRPSSRQLPPSAQGVI